MLGSMFSSSSQAALAIGRAMTAAPLPPHAIFAIDGRTGAGKTSFARELTARLAPASLCTIEVESFIEGWSGLADGVAELAQGPLRQFREQGACELRAWDWHVGRWAETVRVPTCGTCAIMLVVGCGSSSAPIAPLLDGSVWIEAPAGLRRQRVNAREGSPDAWWDMWEAQHTALLAQRDSAREATWSL